MEVQEPPSSFSGQRHGHKRKIAEIYGSDVETYDHVYQNLLDQSLCYIEEHRNEYRDQNSIKEARTALHLGNFVVIVGKQKCGKTSLALALIPESKISSVLVLTEVDELKYIKFGHTFAVIIEDIGGKLHFDQPEVLKWDRKLDMMLAVASQKKVQIIITVNEDVLESWLAILPCHRMFENVVRLPVQPLEDTAKNQDLSNSEGLQAETFSEETRSEQPNRNIEVEAELFGIVDVKSSTDKKLCEIWDITQLSNGIILMTDFSNKKVKKMEQYKVTECLLVPGRPIGICQVEKNSIAVALWDMKIIQFVCIEEHMTLSSKSFAVEDNCSGIACKEDVLYVCCGGKGNGQSVTGKLRGYLVVFDFFGTMLARYENAFSCPEYLYFNTASSKMYVSDAYKGLIVEEDDGVFKTIQINAVNSPAGMCSVRDDILCIAGYSSDNVVVLKDDSHDSKLLSVKKPAGLCFEKAYSRLIVTMAESNIVKVYNLSLQSENLPQIKD